MNERIVRTLRRGLLVSGLSLSAAACGSRQPAAAPPPKAPVTGTAPTPTVSAAPPSKPDDTSAADRIVASALEMTAAMRELPPKAKVRGVTLGRDALSVQVGAAIDRELPPAELTADGEMLVLLGVVPTDFDYRRAVVTLMSEELAGYYEPQDKTMYLAADLQGDMRSATLAHELVHALQDQYFDLSRLDYRPEHSDELSAAHALAEGDAMSCMLDEMLSGRGMRATDLSDALLGAQIRFSMAVSNKASSVPDILKRSLAAPYIDGTRLVNEQRRRGGWAAVNDVWQNPPVTTEQLLHDDKLRTHEAALPVAVPDAPPKGPKTRILADVFGEQGLRLLFEEWMPERTSESSAQGWGGDRGAVYADDGRFALAWHFRADDASSAEKQAAAWARGVVAQGGSGHGAVACAERADRGPLRVERRKQDVVVVAGPYRREGGTPKSDSTCVDAADWASRIFRAPTPSH